MSYFILFFPFVSFSHSNIILAGDSIMVGIASQLHSNLYHSIAKTSSGLINLGYYDIYSKLETALKKYPDSKVYVCIGTNDGRSIGNLKFGSDDWILEYTMRIDLLTAICGKDNIVFVIMPEMKTLPRIKLIRNIILDYVKWNDLDHIDFWDALDDKYRANDKVHCTGKGYALLARRIEDDRDKGR